jgi:MFS family permease
MASLAVVRLLRTNRPLGALVVANGVSAVGDWLYLTVVPIVVYSRTGDASVVGLIAAARLLPWLLLSVPAGILADRLPRRRLLLVVESLRAVLMFAMAAVYVADAPIWMLLALALVATAAGTFSMPVHGTLVPGLSRDDEEIGVANVLMSASDNLACAAGPALAAAVVVFGDPALAFTLNGLSFVLVIGWLILLPADRAVGRVAPTLEEFAVQTGLGGWRGLVRQSAPRLAIDGAISFAAGAMAVLPVVVGVAIVAEGAEASIAILNAAAGGGALGGAVLAGWFVNRNARTGIVVGVAGTVVGFIALAASGVMVTAVIAAVGITAAIVLLEVLNMTELQRSTDDGHLGRVLGLLHGLAAGWTMAGSLAAGVASAVFGPTTTILLCASVVLLLGLIGIAWPRLRTAAVMPEMVPAA